MPEETETSFYGKTYSIGCPGCNRIEPQPDGLAIVYEDEYFRAHQDYALPIPGMMVIETKRHIKRITEFKRGEKEGIANVLMKIRQAMRSVGLEEAVLIQQEKSSHFHVWWLPIHPWMREATNGRLRNIQDIFDYAKKNLKNKEDIKAVEKTTRKIKKSLV